MKMENERKEKLLTNTKRYLERKQNTFLQFEILVHYRNGYIELYYRNDTFTRREIDNIQIKNHELNKTKLWNF